MSISVQAQDALQLVTQLQSMFVEGLQSVGKNTGLFEQTSWLRDEGRHGGGSRFSIADNGMFNRASVNVSQVHYDDPNRKLGSATALSTIVHPSHPYAPSMHMHISWTEMKGDAGSEGGGYWRMMADLNPSIENLDHTQAFRKCLQDVAPSQYAAAAAQGDRYFYIPALERHRGVAHFYLEGYRGDTVTGDMQLARSLGTSVIGCYLSILLAVMDQHAEVTDGDREKQRAYHTLYFFQVLTLDRGTTSGLLVHDQNDVGIMGSLPSHVQKSLLASWADRLPEPQEELLAGLLGVLPEGASSLVDLGTKRKLAQVVRAHYRKYPEALSLQASGDVIPPTVENHRSGIKGFR